MYFWLKFHAIQFFVAKMHIVFISILMNSFFINGFYLPPAGPTTANDTVEEIQHAICKITSKELEATANATITRQLKGVCTSNRIVRCHVIIIYTDFIAKNYFNLNWNNTFAVEYFLIDDAICVNFSDGSSQYGYIQEKLDDLQTKVLRQIEGIKNILETNGFNIPESKTESPDDFRGPLMKKSLNIDYSRADEMSLYNDSVTESTEGSIYHYYWDIHQIGKLLAKKDVYKSSPDFFVLGHTLHLQFYPNHLQETYFGILLRPSSNGFLKKHKFFILNQLQKNSNISSSILNGIRSEDSIFVVSEHTINNKKGFICDDILIIKLELFLNS